MNTRYPVLNLRLGQAGQPMIATRDFNSFFSFALERANELATIARAHELSAEEENEIRRAVGGIEQYTVPQTPCPAQTPCPSAGAAPSTCPIFPPSAPAPATGGIPWWAAAAAGLGVGAAVVGFLA